MNYSRQSNASSKNWLMIPPEQSSKHKFHVTSQISISVAKNRLSVKVTYLMSVTVYIFQNGSKSYQPHSKRKIEDQKEQDEDEKMYLVAQSFCCSGMLLKTDI